MKFFIILFTFLFSVFSLATSEVGPEYVVGDAVYYSYSEGAPGESPEKIPKKDKKYLTYPLIEDLKNGQHGCVQYDELEMGRSIQNPDGTWEDIHSRRSCTRYCRPDTQAPFVASCTITAPRIPQIFPNQATVEETCRGVSEVNYTEAVNEAKAVCMYQIRHRKDANTNNNNIDVSCNTRSECFDIRQILPDGLTGIPSPIE